LSDSDARGRLLSECRLPLGDLNDAPGFVKDAAGGLGGVAANEPGNRGASVSHMHQAGTFFLEINSKCAWHVIVKG
jgi:hypothetical protein